MNNKSDPLIDWSNPNSSTDATNSDNNPFLTTINEGFTSTPDSSLTKSFLGHENFTKNSEK